MWLDRKHERYIWRRWFAWYPVLLTGGWWAWLMFVERRNLKDGGCSGDETREYRHA